MYLRLEDHFVLGILHKILIVLRYCLFFFSTLLFLCSELFQTAESIVFWISIGFIMDLITFMTEETETRMKSIIGY